MSRRDEAVVPEPVVRLSRGKGRRPCKCTVAGKKVPPGFILHSEEVFSDGWTRWVCSGCGGVKFSFGLVFEERK